VKLIVILFAVVVVTGCASQSHQQPAVAAPTETSAPSLFRTITIVETNPVVFVSGEVMHPGRFIWSPGLTLTNAIALAGGFTDFADRRGLEVRRPGSIERYSYRQATTNSVLLERGAVVYVRRRLL
jgi:protein involved in polysaccharide export with SLBB domain